MFKKACKVAWLDVPLELAPFELVVLEEVLPPLDCRSEANLVNASCKAAGALPLATWLIRPDRPEAKLLCPSPWPPVLEVLLLADEVPLLSALAA